MGKTQEVSPKKSTGMYDVIDSVNEIDNYNIIALHKVKDSSGRKKIVLIADNDDNDIIKIDLFSTKGDIFWDITKPSLFNKKRVKK